MEDSFWVGNVGVQKSELSDADYWPHDMCMEPPTKGLMRNLIPHYWPLRKDLPSDGLLSFDELMAREDLTKKLETKEFAKLLVPSQDTADKADVKAVGKFYVKIVGSDKSKAMVSGTNGVTGRKCGKKAPKR
jgi:hypothetical protein